MAVCLLWGIATLFLTTLWRVWQAPQPWPQYKVRGNLFIHWFGINYHYGSWACVGSSLGWSGGVYVFFPANDMVSGGIIYRISINVFIKYVAREPSGFG